MGALMSVRSAQPPAAVPRKASGDIVQGVGKFVHYAVDKPSFQVAGLSVAQLHAHEEQHAFDEHGLASRSNMSDSFIGVTLPAPVIGGCVAGRLHRPKINPRRLALVAERHGADRRKSPGGGSTMNAGFAVVIEMVRDIRPQSCEEGKLCVGRF
jgi:hypothetical protein